MVGWLGGCWVRAAGVQSRVLWEWVEALVDERRRRVCTFPYAQGVPVHSDASGAARFPPAAKHTYLGRPLRSRP